MLANQFSVYFRLSFVTESEISIALPFTTDNIQDATIFVASGVKMTLILTWLETQLGGLKIFLEQEALLTIAKLKQAKWLLKFLLNVG